MRYVAVAVLIAPGGVGRHRAWLQSSHVGFPVVLVCSALMPLAVLLFPVVLRSSAWEPTRRVAGPGGVVLQRA